jgi:hypothetical protein
MEQIKNRQKIEKTKNKMRPIKRNRSKDDISSRILLLPFHVHYSSFPPLILSYLNCTTYITISDNVFSISQIILYDPSNYGY